jgi:16S rRNA (uracil1498-N3)-methyltransferase
VSLVIPRFYCPVPIRDEFDLPDSLAHHAQRVLRLRAGDQITLFDGRGGEYPAMLESVGKKLRVKVGEHLPIERESPLSITLYQALPAGDKMDWVVQKAVELGVSAVVPVSAARSVLKLSGERADRRVLHWQQVALSACEQCGRNREVPVSPIVSLAEALVEVKSVSAFLLAPGASLRVRDLAPPEGALAVFVGPEGGWSEAEVHAARTAGVVPLSFGPRVLRTETAGLAALSALSARFGDG